ncbi:MAG: hypothetical protein WAV18_17665 [Roseiarcus sp.]
MSELNPPGQLSYNKIFETLVKDASNPELEEMISYFIYKKSKREWATNFYERNGNKPNDQNLFEYVETYTPARLKGLLNEARGIIATYAESVIEEVTPQILQRALSERSFVRDASVAAAGGAIYTVILILLALIAKFADIDVLEVLERVFHSK